jgi:hypothetical protein
LAFRQYYPKPLMCFYNIYTAQDSPTVWLTRLFHLDSPVPFLLHSHFLSFSRWDYRQYIVKRNRKRPHQRA